MELSDIGGVGVTGGASYANSTFTLDGAGEDIWNDADEFHYVYQPISGDCAIIARVASQQDTAVWAKAGVMMRADLTAGAANAFMAITPSEGAAAQWRDSAGIGCANTQTTGIAAPYWVKLVRNGNNFSFYYSSNGQNWIADGTVSTISMPETIYIGLAVDSWDDPTLCTAAFDNVSIQSNITSMNLPSLQLVGNASIVNGSTLQLTPASAGQAGAGWSAHATGCCGRVSSTFQFQLSGGNGSCDGIAFVIQNSSSTALGSSGGGKGYDGIPNSLAVQLCTYDDSGYGDPNNNFISIQSRGTNPNSQNLSYSLGTASSLPSTMDDGNVHTVTIVYTPGTMSIYLDNSAAPVLTASVNLATLLDLNDGNAWVGFTGGTGAAYQNEDILSWNFFSPTMNPTTLNFAGNASVVNGNELQLTPASGFQAGAGWSPTQQAVAEGFSTSFIFQLSGGNGNCDGIAFVIQNSSSTALGGAGGEKGYYGIPNGLAVQMECYGNNYISIQSTSSSNSLGATSSLPSTMDDGKEHLVTIDYIPGTMTIYLDNSQVLTAYIDLATLLDLNNGAAWVGFTGGTGAAYQYEDILAWDYQAVPIITSFTPSSGPAGTSVTITGSSFTTATAVAFGDTPATAFTIVNDNTITATVGSGTTGAIERVRPPRHGYQRQLLHFHPGADPYRVLPG